MSRLLDLLDEDKVVEEVPTETIAEVEPEVIEDEPEVIAAVEDEPKDFEFDIEEDELEPEVKPKRTAEDSLIHKLSKKGRQLKGVKTELEQAREEIEALKAAQLAPAPIQPQAPPIPTAPEQSLSDQYGYPPFPVLYENGINSPEDFQAAYRNREAEVAKIDASKAAANTQTNEYTQSMESKMQSLGNDADKFFTDKGIDPERGTDFIANAAREFDSHTKHNGALVLLLDAVGEGSSAVAYHLGSKSAKGIAALSKVKSLIDKDPSGLSAVAYMAALKRDLTPKVRKVKTDIEPDEALVGGNNSLKASTLQRKYDDENDFGKLRAIMREAKTLGIELKSS